LRIFLFSCAMAAWPNRVAEVAVDHSAACRESWRRQWAHDTQVSRRLCEDSGNETHTRWLAPTKQLCRSPNDRARGLGNAWQRRLWAEEARSRWNQGLPKSLWRSSQLPLGLEHPPWTEYHLVEEVGDCDRISLERRYREYEMCRYDKSWHPASMWIASTAEVFGEQDHADVCAPRSTSSVRERHCTPSEFGEKA